MFIRHYLTKIRQTPPQQLPTKARRWLYARLKETRQQWQSQWGDRYFPTYSPYPFAADCPLYSYFPPYPKNALLSHREQILALADLYSQHYFECLGSGWVNVRHGITCQGLEGYQFPPNPVVIPDYQGKWLKNYVNSANFSYSQKIWKQIDPNYCPIDWQLDFKSGYRWSALTPSPNIRYAHKLGVDIKVPWELARMHHLPILAWAYGCEVTNNPTHASYYQQEFCHQILDFIATNPPRYGVNWRCAMDVGIRVVNWLVAYDLFQALGAAWNADFQAIFNASVYNHGRYLINHLEWDETLRSNHYFADIAGLLFVAAYLPRSIEIDAWLAFAVQELIDETEIQFHPDGSNFEGSTSYHRLSAEMLLYSTLLCANLPNDKRHALKDYQCNSRQTPPLRPFTAQRYDLDSPTLLPQWVWERLRKAGQFTQDITKPNGEVVQVGDNDSGRFLKLWPSFIPLTSEQALENYTNLSPAVTSLPIFWDEQILNHQHLITAIATLLNATSTKLDDVALASSTMTPETALIQTLQIHATNLSPQYSTPATPDSKAPKSLSLTTELSMLCKQYGNPNKIIFTAQNDIQQELTLATYPNFGIYIYQSPHLFVSIRCGNTGQKGNGGHAHNDQLSIELILDGQMIIQDPGTYLYTPLPERRNQYRATQSHFTPQIPNQEQNTWYDGVMGLFSLKTQHYGQCIYCDKQGFLGTHSGYGHPVFRLILIEPKQITIFDWGGDPNYYKPLPISTGYGRLARGL